MRGISKPAPPSDVYPHSGVRTNLDDAEATFLSSLPGASNAARFARSEYDQLSKQGLRHVMYREQHALCIYCERRIAEGALTSRIDHWFPLSRNPELALHWDNLYLSCPTPDTCDSAKRDHPFRWDDADMPRPVDLRYEDVVGFTPRGEIYVRLDASLTDATREAMEHAIGDHKGMTEGRRGVVYLNHPALVAARAAALTAEHERMARTSTNLTPTDAGRHARAVELLESPSRPAFVSIRLAWLLNQLGQGL